MSEDFRRRELRRLGAHALLNDGHILPLDRANEGVFDGFCDEVLAYFKQHDIKWWNSGQEAAARKSAKMAVGPTGHLTSSQLACVNHLEPARQDPSLALAIVQSLDSTVVEVLPIPGEDGFVAFEWLPTQDLLNESTRRTRGANVTSLDALMLARRKSGGAITIAVEWKYLETYGHQQVPQLSTSGTDRLARYKALLDDRDSPLLPGDPMRLFYEPYYQLMRQTLLAWQLTRSAPQGWPQVDDWIHVHVIPKDHSRLRRHVPRGVGAYAGQTTLESAWRAFLKEPGRYRMIDPSELIPQSVENRWLEWREWLSARYGT